MVPILTTWLDLAVFAVIWPRSTPRALCQVVGLVAGAMSVTKSAGCRRTTTVFWLKHEPGSFTRCSVRPGVASWDVVVHQAQGRCLIVVSRVKFFPAVD